MWVVIHMCMEAMLGISLYSYLYLKLAKTLCRYVFLIISYVFSSTKSENKREEQVLPPEGGGEAGVWGRQQGEMSQTMYTHMNK
jgi:hypothetical protein